MVGVDAKVSAIIDNQENIATLLVDVSHTPKLFGILIVKYLFT